MHRYKLTLTYDGTFYFGWQKTKTGPSIQETLEKAIQKIEPKTSVPEGASRTDRGVHAEGQVVSMDLTKDWDPKQLLKALNAHLPVDIKITHIQKTTSDFHPSLQAIEKEYRYRVCLGSVQEPFHRLYSWAFRYPLDLRRMEKASKDFLGTHNFAALANKSKNNPICTLNRILISPLPDNRLEILIAGNRFLYKMVRNVVGTLIYIGCDKLAENIVPDLLASRSRPLAGMTAPAHGLTLVHVRYVL